MGFGETRKVGEVGRVGGAGAIRFGTSGWRGVLGEGVDFAGLRALTRATAEWLRGQSPHVGVLVGYDTRFASARMAATSAQELRIAGLEPRLVREAIPTPVLTHAIRRRRVAGGLMLTASHNPPEYHGLKVFGASGCGLADVDARRIEAGVGEPLPAPRSELALRHVDLITPYRRALLALVDIERLAAARPRVTYDAMHGAGAGVLDGVLRDAGARVTLMRGEPDPLFGGQAPDPTPAGLVDLSSRMRSQGAGRIGLATDGDGDRFGVVLRGGRILSETEVIALLVDHLARTGRVRKGVGLSHCTGSLAEKVAAEHGLPVVRTPVGFKHLGEQLASGRVDVAGEESGGFALGRMGWDKDGLLAGVLVSEIAASQRGGVGERLGQLERRHGRSACGRRALERTPSLDSALDRMLAAPPDRVGDASVREVNVQDGLRLALDDGFVMLRRSGTEPVVRLYAEAAGPRRLARRIGQVETILRAAQNNGS